MLDVNQRLGDFQILRLLGKGGMGEVYEAQQFHPSRRVALKVLAPWLTQSEEALERFEREAAVPAQLDHPGIVRIISTGRTDDGLAYYTMQLVRGISLSRLLTEAALTPQPHTVVQPTTSESGQPHEAGSDPVPEPSAEDLVPELVREYRDDRFRVVVRLGLKVARALAAAHRHGVLHRDVKPSNLMIDRHRELYVVDFGLTKALAPDGIGTGAGILCGTPWYMSPEQSRGEPLDARSDLFSLGVTLYELTTGGVGPYAVSRGENEAVLQEVRAGKVMPLRSYVPDVPADLEHIIRKAMEHKPRRRYRVAEEMAADLERLGERRDTPTATVRGKWQRWFPAPAAWGVGLAGVLMVLAIIWRPGSRPGPAEGSGADPAEVEAVRPDPIPPLPQVLRDPEPNLAIPLLRPNFEPLWSCKVCGKGKFNTIPPFGLFLGSHDGNALVALDNPGKCWFEFAIEMQTVPWKKVLSHGVFFGLQPQPSGISPARRFFLLSIREESPGAQKPSTMQLQLFSFSRDPDDAPGKESAFYNTAPGAEAAVDLPPRQKDRQGYRSIRVNAAEDELTVSVDGNNLSVDVKKLKLDPRGDRPGARGLLGIWASKGAGEKPGYVGGGAFFRNATVAVHP
jgi:serine/threonine protein kinase